MIVIEIRRKLNKHSKHGKTYYFDILIKHEIHVFNN